MNRIGVSTSLAIVLSTAAWSAPISHAASPPGKEPSAGATQGSGQETSCVGCHLDDELWEPEELAVFEGLPEGVHSEVGLSCHDCHGGNPDPALSEDYGAAMDEDFAANPYRGAVDPSGIPGSCGACHSDTDYMRRFGPAIPVDQESEYRTSRHGEALESGDSDVATCSSCHGFHGVRRVTDPRSRVYATNVGETCARCHDDAQLMSGYRLSGGQPMPIGQLGRWRESVHAEAMFEREDLTAPTCNDCHGNHGARPPGIDAVTFVCGQCHGREAEIFRASPKRAGFERHNDYLTDAEGEGCIACHDPPEPAASLVDFRSFGECASCHGNHGVVRPTLSFLSPLPDTPCAFCHEAGGGVHFDEPEDHLLQYEEALDVVLAEAAAAGLEGSDRYDWLVDRSLELPFHTVGATPDGIPARRPEFDRLFTKFRIGKTAFTYEEPGTGAPVRVPILRCASCHADVETLGDDAAGMRVAGEILGHMRELTSRTASAERVLLRARRGGVETGAAELEVDRAIDAQIGLEVLLHSFDTGEGSEFMGAHAEGMAHADAAADAGQEALGELLFRRQGLAVALGLILLVLIALGLKIREVSSPDETG